MFSSYSPIYRYQSKMLLALEFYVELLYWSCFWTAVTLVSALYFLSIEIDADMPYKVWFATKRSHVNKNEELNPCTSAEWWCVDNWCASRQHLCNWSWNSNIHVWTCYAEWCCWIVYNCCIDRRYSSLWNTKSSKMCTKFSIC